MRVYKKYSHSYNKKRDWSNYHRVSFKDLSRGRVDISRCVDELNKRTDFTKKYYNGKFDERHQRVMHRIGQYIKGEAALGLSLDALIASRKITLERRKYPKKYNSSYYRNSR